MEPAYGTLVGPNGLVQGSQLAYGVIDAYGFAPDDRPDALETVGEPLKLLRLHKSAGTRRPAQYCHAFSLPHAGGHLSGPVPLSAS